MNVNSRNYYDVGVEGRLWLTKALGTFGMLGLGWYAGQLAWVTSVAIIVFVYWEGFRPYRVISRYLSREMHHSLSFIAEVSNYGETIAREIVQMNTAGGSAALKLAVAVLRVEGRIDKKVAVDMFVSRLETQLDKLIMPVKIASELATGLGMFGSMIGIAQALLTMDLASEELQKAFQTMAFTTVVGLAGMIVLTGLCSRLENAKQILCNELRMFGYLIAGLEARGGDATEDQDHF